MQDNGLGMRAEAWPMEDGEMIDVVLSKTGLRSLTKAGPLGICGCTCSCGCSCQRYCAPGVDQASPFMMGYNAVDGNPTFSTSENLEIRLTH